MKPLSPHDPRNDALDDLIAAALHGELTPGERAQFESRLSTDPAAQAAYQEALAMHDLLEKTHKSAQPDPAFEQRMVSGVRRKIQHDQHRETAWESLLALWMGLKKFFVKRRAWEYAVTCMIVVLLAGVTLGPITHSLRMAKQSALMQEERQRQLADAKLADASDAESPPPSADGFRAVTNKVPPPPAQPQLSGFEPQPVAAPVAAPPSVITMMNGNFAVDNPIVMNPSLDRLSNRAAQGTGFGGANGSAGGVVVNGGTLTSGAGTLIVNEGGTTMVATPQAGAVRGPGFSGSIEYGRPIATKASGGTIGGSGLAFAGAASVAPAPPTASPSPVTIAMNNPPASSSMPAQNNAPSAWNKDLKAKAGEKKELEAQLAASQAQLTDLSDAQKPKLLADNTVAAQAAPSAAETTTPAAPSQAATDSASPGQVNGLLPVPSTTPPAIDTRKLIRNAQLDLEVKSFQSAMDQITALTKTAGGYVDTSNSQKGGNGKLQGAVVVKVLPQNLDGFLLKLRDLGEVKNQSVSTDDVTKDYFDTQARLDNSRRMEAQLQDLLKHANSKVADLLQVERELGRVRGDIEQMQGQLKLYDFQVQYATVTMNVSEKDLKQAAAYLLKEQDDFSLFATDVEGTFQKARQSADDFKAQVLVANLNHNSGSDVSAELTVMVAPDQIEPFLAQVRGLGRVANFTRQTQRVARDGGDSDDPADQTLTEKDKVQVHLAIRSDDETRKQVALTVVAKAVDDALDQAKAAALANAGVEILSSSLNKTPQGQSTAQLTLRVPGKDYSALIAAMEALGRTASLSIQRNDNSGPGANGDDAPVIVSLALTDDDTPLQETELSVLAGDVDNQAQQIKKDAAAAGVEVKASSFERQPDGTELAQMTFRLPMSKYAAFVESVKALGKVESLTVRRDDRPDQTRADDTAPAEITLQLHNQRDIVADNSGLWATLRQTFGEGAAALFGSVRVIGVVVAFLTPWVFTVGLFAWIGRRIYIWRKK